MPFYAPATRGTMNEINTLVPYILHSISHLLCVVLALGSATCNTENSMFVIPGSARMHYCCVWRDGAMMCIIRMVWCANIVDLPRVSMNSAGNA